MRWSHSLLALLFSMNIVFVAILATASQVLYQRTADEYQFSILENIQQETVSFSNLVGKDLEFAMSRMYALLVDEVLQRLAIYMNLTPWDSSSLQDAEYIWNTLKNIENSCEMLSDVCIYLPEQERKITTESVARLDDDDRQAIALLKARSAGEESVLTETALYLISERVRKEGDASILIAASITPSSLERYIRTVFATNFQIYLSATKNGVHYSLTSAPLPEEISASPASLFRGNGAAYFGDAQETGIAWASLRILPITFYQIFSEDEVAAQLDRFNHNNHLYQALTVAVGTAFMLLVYILVCSPLRRMQRVMRQVEGGQLDIRLGKTWSTEFQYVFYRFDKMETRLQTLIEQEYLLKLRQKDTEIKMLQYQINPHFLYNTYFMLEGLIVEDEYDSAALLANLMGKYMRYITHTDRQDSSLEEEIEHAQAYLQIQGMRFSRRVKIIAKPIPVPCRSMRVPRLVVQPLLENAFEHGIKGMLQGAVVRLAFEVSPDALDIIVEDNGASMEDAILEKLRQTIQNDAPGIEGVALQNIAMRIRWFYGAGSSLLLERSDLGGLRCVLHILRKECS